MATKVQIHLVEAALLELLSTRLKISYGMNVDVESIGKGDFDEDGQLVLKSPAVRLIFVDGHFGSARDNQRVTLNTALIFSAACYHESLRSKAQERTRSFQLLGTVADELAGARLKLSEGVYTEPILLTGAVQVMDAGGPVDQCFAVTFTVTGIAQFSGVNANFGAKA
jgi:hypothetical protein